MNVPYGKWEPDRHGPGVRLRVCEGVISIAEGYGPFPQMIGADGAETLSGSPRGLISVLASDGNWYVFAATASKIEQMQSDFTWTDIETGRTVPTGEDVSFAVFGAYLINTDTTSGLRAYNIVGGGSNSAVSGAPSARFVFTCGNALFALGTAAEPRRFANSDRRDHTKWSGGVANGNSFQDGGALVGGADQSNGYGIILQESAVRGIIWQGSQYSVPLISEGLGCVAARTIGAYNGKIAFWDENGPWVIDGQSAPVNIGVEKINRWAAENIGRQNFKNLQCTVDPQRQRFLWRIDASQVLAWGWMPGLDDFTILPAQTAALARIATPAVTVDGLTGTVDQLEGTIDDLGGSSAPVLGGLNSALKYATFTGQNMAATLETGVTNAPQSGWVNWATPLDDCASGTLQVGMSDSLSDSLVWESGEAKLADGSVPLRARGHNMAFRRNIPGGATWKYANGIGHVVGARAGRR